MTAVSEALARPAADVRRAALPPYTRRLLIWSFAIGHARRSLLPICVLSAPAFGHCYLATPAIDRDCLDETLDAMLDAVSKDPSLPKIVALDMLETDGATAQVKTEEIPFQYSGTVTFTGDGAVFTPLFDDGSSQG